MRFAEKGKLLSQAPLLKRKDACVFIHGTSDTELGWQKKPGTFDFGERLFLDYNIQPLYVRYNSGLAIHENGLELAQLLDELVLKNKALRTLSLVGHSMGGLVIHSAIVHAQLKRLAWTKKVKRVFLLGTPHEGAPLAKFAEKAEQLLQFIPNPAALLGASVIGLRSQGLKELSRGQKTTAQYDTVLLPHADYIFVAGSLAQKPLSRLFGDGMVHPQSALPAAMDVNPTWKTRLARLARGPRVRLHTLPGIGHLALRHADAVYSVIAAEFG